MRNFLSLVGGWMVYVYFYMEHFLSFAVLLFPSSSLYLHAKKAKKLRIADFDDAPVLRFPRPIIYRQRERAADVRYFRHGPFPRFRYSSAPNTELLV